MSLLILHNCTIGFGIIIVDSMLCMMDDRLMQYGQYKKFIHKQQITNLS